MAEGVFALGEEIVTLTIGDGPGTASSTVRVNVEDDTAPSIFLSPSISTTTCGTPGELDLPLPDVVDDCSAEVDLSAMVYFSADPSVQVGIPFAPEDIRYLPTGTHYFEWTATDDAGNTATAEQVIEILPAVQADTTFRVLNGARVVDDYGELAAIANSGDLERFLEVQAEVGDVFSVAPVELRNYALVDGSVYTAEPIEPAYGAMITGSVFAVQPELPSLRLPGDFPTTNAGDFNLEPDQSGALLPGSYSNVSVESRATLFLEPGEYYVDRLQLELQATVALTGNGLIEIYIREGLQHRGQFLGSSHLQIGYAGTSTVYLEAPFHGRIIAPNADVVLRGNYVGDCTVGSPNCGENAARAVMVAYYDYWIKTVVQDGLGSCSQVTKPVLGYSQSYYTIDVATYVCW